MQTAEPYKLEGMIGFLEGRRKTKRNDGLYKWVLWKQALTDTLLRFSKIEPDEKWNIRSKILIFPDPAQKPDLSIDT